MTSPETPGRKILESVRFQVSLGPRAPGLPGHVRLREHLRSHLDEQADEVFEQRFRLYLPQGEVQCANLIGLFHGSASLPSSERVLLGTHFDTRLRADREKDPAQRNRPIPGANDGGSGTAILLNLLPFLKQESLKTDVVIVFFDAEDVGEIGGYPFSYGARVFLHRPPLPLPTEVLVIDMVGGKGLLLDIDAHILEHPPSLELSRRVFHLGLARGYPPFRSWEAAAGKIRHIICDHIPFLAAGIPSCLLIDLDYAPWHTQADLPEAMSEDSLSMISEVVKLYLRDL